MLDSESKFEKVQGIWFDDIDWGVTEGYEMVGSSGQAEKGCVYLTSGYARGCKKITGKGDGGSGAAFQRRIGKEKVKLINTGWGVMIGKVGFAVALIEMVKSRVGNKNSEDFKSKWNEWFEVENGDNQSCLEVTENKNKEKGAESSSKEYEYKKKKCKWRLRSNKRGDALEIFKKVFADEKTWAEKSFTREHIEGLCEKGGSRWQEDSFGNNGKDVMEEVRRGFEEAHCSEGKSKYEKGNSNYVKDWGASNNIKVIEGEVFGFGNKESIEYLAFEKEGDGKEVFEKAENGKRQGKSNNITAGDWLKLARWGGSRADQSCHSVKQWNTRNHKEASTSSNQCVKDEATEGGDGGGKWLNDQSWENLKGWFGLGAKSSEDNCQWLMKEPFETHYHSMFWS
ncbi:hypothetical protein [Mycoplasma suis]|uniref:Uncharacterized protein n=1 Tax=Mycoplasma suis (strain Illinois) TaxID=768700 RepID=F0QRV4_MYCSL|nr:hypothetical protein [Mycoplasma suis]ADX98224.1 hypothetical protein MSU_0693 [Mycoplasma suis str. Illinois]